MKLYRLYLAVFHLAFVRQGDTQPSVKEGQLLQPALYYLIVEFCRVKHPCIRQKCNLGAALVSFSHFLKVRLGCAGNYFLLRCVIAAFKLTAVYFIIVIYFHRHPAAERIYHRCAYTVQTAAVFII